MMFKSGDTIRHISCIDVDLYIHKLFNIHKDYLKLKVSYINRHNKMNYGEETVIIQKEDLYKWNLVNG